MAGKLYFLPGTTIRPSAEELKQLGIESDHPLCPRECTGQGPSGGIGVTLGDPSRMGTYAIGIYKNQHWEEVHDETGRIKYYVGWYDDAKPTPADLNREIQLPGPLVTLADGNEWQVPRIQAWNEEQALHEIALPRKRRRHPSGQWYRGEVLDEYKALLQQGHEFWQVLMDAAAKADGASFNYDWPPLHDFAATLLTINYAMTIDDVSALGLFDGDDRASTVATAAVEWSQLVDWLKKKAMGSPSQEGGSGNSSLGQEESAQDFAQGT